MHSCGGCVPGPESALSTKLPRAAAPPHPSDPRSVSPSPLRPFPEQHGRTRTGLRSHPARQGLSWRPTPGLSVNSSFLLALGGARLAGRQPTVPLREKSPRVSPVQAIVNPAAVKTHVPASARTCVSISLEGTPGGGNPESSQGEERPSPRPQRLPRRCPRRPHGSVPHGAATAGVRRPRRPREPGDHAVALICICLTTPAGDRPLVALPWRRGQTFGPFLNWVVPTLSTPWSPDTPLPVCPAPAGGLQAPSARRRLTVERCASPAAVCSCFSTFPPQAGLLPWGTKFWKNQPSFSSPLTVPCSSAH